jgi:hypothetical protein
VSFEPVDVLVATDSGDPVEGVLVKVYDPTGAVFFTQAITDSDGIASFMLETIAYTMRFYKFQVGFTQPQHFTVLAAPEVNVFDVVAELFDLPIATDPRLCRCSGFFRDLDGSPRQWLDMHIMAEFDPILLDDVAVVTEELHLRTDENGYACVDLIRGANYHVNVEALGSQDLRRLCRVPDSASCNLPDLLFPIVERITFDPEAPFNVLVGVGNEIEVTPTVYDSAGRPLTGTANLDVRWSVEDDSIAVIVVLENTITIRGNAAGTTRLLAERMDSSIIKIPDVPIEGVPVDIVVT